MLSLAACLPGKPDDSDTAGSGTSGTSSTSGASDSPTSGTASTGEATTTAPTTTGTDAMTTSGGLPPECETADPTVAGEFELQNGDWPDDIQLYHPGILCTVDGVTDQAGTVTTALACDVDGMSLSATVEISAAPEGPVAWTVGDSVRLSYNFNPNVFPAGSIRQLQLRDPDDDSVLMFASDSKYDESIPHNIAPLTFGIGLACHEETDRPTLPTLLRFGLPDDQGEVDVIHRHRGALPIDASDHYIIDVADAQGNGIHKSERVAFLLRRVHVGG